MSNQIASCLQTLSQMKKNVYYSIKYEPNDDVHSVESVISSIFDICMWDGVILCHSMSLKVNNEKLTFLRKNIENESPFY